MPQFKFESGQAAWKYYLNLDSHNFEEKQHNNIYTDAFEAGAEWEHKRLVAKACEWLWNEIYERIDDYKIRESLCDDNYRANLVAAFREAMEE